MGIIHCIDIYKYMCTHVSVDALCCRRTFWKHLITDPNVQGINDQCVIGTNRRFCNIYLLLIINNEQMNGKHKKNFQKVIFM